jgi:serine/threonine-protein kinase
MELLTGTSLEGAVRRQKPPMLIREFIAVMRDVAGALAAAHKSGVIHRDLKPTNVFLHKDRDGRVIPKVLDFGVSKVLEEGNDSLTVVGTILGSPLYMSPEQAMGAEGIDSRTDIFAFGSILFEALCGQRAYSGSNLNALIVAIATTQPKSIDEAAPDLSEEIRSLVRDCMITDKAKRLASFDAVVERVERILVSLADSEARLPVPVRKSETPPPPPASDGRPRPGADWPGAASGDAASLRLPPPATPTALAISTPLPLGRHTKTSTYPVWLSFVQAAPPSARAVAGAIAAIVILAAVVAGTRGGSPANAGAAAQALAPPQGGAIGSVAPPSSASPPAAAVPGAPADSSDVPVVSVDSLPLAGKGGSRAKSNGRLTVAATPGACSVSIDGVARGETPLPSLELSVGIHRVECAPATGAPQSVKVVISEGTESHYQFALAQ